MNVVFSAQIDGRIVPLEDCDWVLRDPCGCPAGVTVGAFPRLGYYTVTEEAAWRALFDDTAAMERAQQAGAYLELMTHQRWRDEVADEMLKHACTHERGAA